MGLRMDLEDNSMLQLEFSLIEVGVCSHVRLLVCTCVCLCISTICWNFAILSLSFILLFTQAHCVFSMKSLPHAPARAHALARSLPHAHTRTHVHTRTRTHSHTHTHTLQDLFKPVVSKIVQQIKDIITEAAKTGESPNKIILAGGVSLVVHTHTHPCRRFSSYTRIHIHTHRHFCFLARFHILALSRFLSLSPIHALARTRTYTHANSFSHTNTQTHTVSLFLSLSPTLSLKLSLRDTILDGEWERARKRLSEEACTLQY